MKQQNQKIEQEQQSFLQSQIAMSEVLGEILDAKETQRAVKISKSSIEQSKIYYEKFRNQKIKNYFLIYIGIVAFFFFANLIEKDILNTYYATIFFFFTSFSLNLYEKSEVGYVKKMMSEQDKEIYNIITFYVFQKVPEIRYITLLVTVLLFFIIPFLTLYAQIYELSIIVIYLMLFLTLVFASFYEFIFKGYIK